MSMTKSEKWNGKINFGYSHTAIKCQQCTWPLLQTTLFFFSWERHFLYHHSECQGQENNDRENGEISMNDMGQKKIPH